MPSVVDLRVDVDVVQSRSHHPNVLVPGIKFFCSGEQVPRHHPQQAEVGVHGPSSLAREGLDAGDVSPQDEVVNVVRSFVRFHRF